MNKSSIGVTERRRREEPSPSDSGIGPPSKLSLRLATDTKDVEWDEADGGSDLVRSLEGQLEIYLLATLDAMEVPPAKVALSFLFEPDRPSEATLKSIVGKKQRRAIMVALADGLRRMVESEVRDASPFPIEIVLDTSAATATSVVREEARSVPGTAADPLTSELELGHRRDMSEVEQKPINNLQSPTRLEDAADEIAQQSEGQPAELHRERLPARPKSLYMDLMEHIEQFLRANPTRAAEFLEDSREIAERYRPLDTHRNLGIQDAVRITGLSEARIYQLTVEEDLGEKIGTRWKFSEAELIATSQKERKVGRPPKQATPEIDGKNPRQKS